MLLLLTLACTSKDTSGDDTSSGTDTSATDTSDTGDTGDTAVAVPWTKDDEDAVMSALARDMRRSGAFAGQIAIWYDGQIVFSQAVGTRTDGGSEPVDTNTLFQIGSDTKKIAAIALLQQVNAGKLSLDEPVADAIPGLSLTESPEWAGAATLHDLVSHQGGLYDYTPWTPAADDNELHDIAFGDFAERNWAMAPGGSFWNYSNPNFSLVGLATETADGRPWADIVEDDIFAPLGLTHTYARLSEVLDDGNVGNSTGYYDFVGDPADLFASATYESGEVAAADLDDNAFIRPAGLVWSTAEDQARLLGFFLDGDDAVLPEALRTQITTAQVPLYPNFPPQSYGYGMFVFDGFSTAEGWCPQPLWTHGGNTLTYTSASVIIPDQRLTLSILTNAYGVDTSTTTQAFYDHMVTLPATTALPVDLAVETDHSLLVGTYVDHQLGRIEVTDVDGTLHAAFPDVTADGWNLDADLSFSWTDEYVLAGGTLRGYDITFIADESGDYRYARNRQFVGLKQE